MALQASGQISVSDVYQEETGSSPSSNADISLGDSVTLAVNTWVTPPPEKNEPYNLSDFYGTAKK